MAEKREHRAVTVSVCGPLSRQIRHAEHVAAESETPGGFVPLSHVTDLRPFVFSSYGRGEKCTISTSRLHLPHLCDTAKAFRIQLVTRDSKKCRNIKKEPGSDQAKGLLFIEKTRKKYFVNRAWGGCQDHSLDCVPEGRLFQ